MRLLPREEKFFQDFQAQAAHILEAAKLLRSMLGQSPAKLTAIAEQLDQLESRGDSVVREVLKKLQRTFITPLDPEDIHRVTHMLDTVLDEIEEAGHLFELYKLDPMPQPMVELCDVIVGCAEQLGHACVALSKSRPLNDECEAIAALEDRADKLTRKALGDLFEQETNPIALIKKKEIYVLLEKVTDECKSVAYELQNVSVKNS